MVWRPAYSAKTQERKTAAPHMGEQQSGVNSRWPTRGGTARGQCAAKSPAQPHFSLVWNSLPGSPLDRVITKK